MKRDGPHLSADSTRIIPKIPFPAYTPHHRLIDPDTRLTRGPGRNIGAKGLPIAENGRFSAPSELRKRSTNCHE